MNNQSRSLAWTLAWRGLLLAGLAAVGGGLQGMAQDRTAPPKVAPADLAAEQATVVEMVDEILAKFQGIASVLESTNPQQAQRVQQALDDTTRNLTKPRMKNIETLLRTGKLQEARVEQEKLLADLQGVLGELTKQIDLESELEKLQKMEALKKELAELAKKQVEQEQKQKELDEQQRKLEALDAQLATLDDILKMEKEILEQLKQAGDAEANLNLSELQNTNAEKTEKIAGENPLLSEAAKHEREAMKQVKEGQRENAQKSAQKAVDELEKAKEQLQAAREAMAGKIDPNKVATAQEELAKQVEELRRKIARDMPESAVKLDETLRKAEQKMQEAGQNVRRARGDRRRDPGEAQDPPDKAPSEDLEEAKKELEERVTQYRDALIRQIFLHLNTEFRDMQAEQLPVSEKTFGLHQQRVGDKRDAEPPPLTRPQSVVVDELAAREKELFDRATLLAPFILDEGTSTTLPLLMDQLILDLESANQQLKTGSTGFDVQTIQKHIGETLEDLIFSTTKKGQDGLPSYNNNALPDDNNPLQQKIRELEILLNMQRRLADATRGYHSSVQGLDRIDEATRKRLERLEQQQERLRQMTVEFYEK